MSDDELEIWLRNNANKILSFLLLLGALGLVLICGGVGDMLLNGSE